MGWLKGAWRRGGKPLFVVSGLAAAQLAWACTGSIGDGGDGAGAGGPGDTEPAAFEIGSTTRFARMTHEQYDRTVRVLLGRTEDETLRFSDTFRADAGDGNYDYDNATLVLGVDQGLHRAYEQAAAAIAEFFVEDPDLLARWVPTEGSDEDRVRGFIRDYGERVHRRPLTEAQVDEYFSLFTLGSTTYDEHPGVTGAVRLITEALFTSPHFLYRTEMATDVEDGVIPLDGWDIASRLSFALWNEMPDDDLFAAARDGSLEAAAGLGAQVERMLGDDRAVTVFTRVLSQAMGVYRYGNIGPNPALFPDVPDDLSALAIDELAAMMRDAFVNGGTYRDILLEPRAFVNDQTAPLYGLDTASLTSEFEPVSLPAAERRGLLTSVGFLTSNSSSANPDPIHRGLFIAQRLLCIDVSAPPGEIPPLPTPEPDQTNREAIEIVTEQPNTNCANCHQRYINPFGFPFENFDAAGSIREDDRGNELDLATSPEIDGETITVGDSLELIDELAEREVVYECFGQLLTSYLMGRPYVRQDAQLRQVIGDRAYANRNVVELVTGGLVSPQFTHRRLEEEL
ncbi:MAG: DUF1592 domain-containing protein [Myxococcota bacterium]